MFVPRAGIAASRTWHTFPGAGKRKRKGRDADEALTSALLATAAAIMGIVAASASASGPAKPGKEVVLLTCDRLGTILVAVQRGANANGAGQIVDANGHGIPVDATLTLTDLTTSTVIDTQMTATGHGSGHPNQAATHCTGVLLQGPASDFPFDTGLPPGVAPTDTVQLSIDTFAIIKP
jgi:hypothetical protein